VQWFFPSWNGDVRIEMDADDPRHTRLTVIEPTAHELELLAQSNNVFRAKGWVDSDTRLWSLKGDQDRQHTVVRASLLEVGLILLGRLKPGIATLTAITTHEGTVEAMGSSETGFLAWVNRSLQGDASAHPTAVNFRDQDGYAKLQLAKRQEAERQEAEQKRREEELAKIKADEAAAQKRAEEDRAKAAREERERKEREDRAKKEREQTAATTVRRPTSCCPDCVPAVITPAEEVLLHFLDDEQRSQWRREKRLVAIGGLTGHRYLIAHRNSPTAVRNTKCTFDLDDDAVMHFHDWSVPPEEEVLAAKLILEHREHWLRHEATCLRNHQDVFKNPFGDGADGTQDAFFTHELGEALHQIQTGRPFWPR
jgi:hypothetical protein